MHTGLELRSDASGVNWEETRTPGVRWKLLASEGRGAGTAEEVLVLAGGYRDERGIHRAGDYVRYEPGSAHAPVALGDTRQPSGPDNADCILYATAPGGIERLDAAPPGPGATP